MAAWSTTRCGRRARRTPISGWSRPGPTGPSPRLRASPGDTRELVSRVYGVRARRLGHLPIGADRTQRQAAAPLSRRLRAQPARRAAQAHRRPRHPSQPLRNGRRPLRRTGARPGSSAGHARAQVHRRGTDARRTDVIRRSRGLHHFARRASAAVRTRASGRAARGRPWRRVGIQRSDQRRHHQGVAVCSGQGGRRRAGALEAPDDADPGAAGKHVEQATSSKSRASSSL